MKYFYRFLAVCLFFGGQSVYAVLGTDVASYGLVLQPNGNSVAAGAATVCDITQFMAARYSTGGSLDTSWGNAGASLAIAGGSSSANAVTIQSSDNRIVAAGLGDNNFALARFNTDGTLDDNFGTGGVVTSSFGDSAEIYSVAMQSTSIIVVGSAYNYNSSGVSQLAIARYTSTGSLDTSFGTSGITVTSIGDGCNLRAVGFQSSGKIIGVGVAVISGTPVIAMARYTSSGSLDTSFGSSGIVTTTIDDTAVGLTVAIDGSDNIFVGGYTTSGGSNAFLVVKYNSSGSLDTSFGTSGATIVVPSGSTNNFGYSIALDSNGNVLLGGVSDTNGCVIRLTTTGGLDTSFNGDGIVILSVGDQADFQALAIQSDQNILAAGYSDLSSLIARYTTGGSLDTNYNSTGYLLAPVGNLDAPCITTNYANAYDTGTQTVSLAGTFQDITFGTNVALEGWEHAVGSASFTCQVAGLYDVFYRVTAENNVSTAANQTLSVIVTQNGTEVTGSQMVQGINSVVNFPECLDKHMLINCAAGDILKVRFTGSNTTVRIRGGVGSGSSDKPSAEFVIRQVN